MYLLDVFFIMSVLSGAVHGIFFGSAWYFHILLGVAALIGTFVGLIVVYLLFLFICTLFYDINKPVEGKAKKFHLWNVSQVVYGINRISGARPVYEGLELIPKDRRYILVANHLSNLDPMLFMTHLIRDKIMFISKPSNFKAPIAGPFIHMCKFLSIDRENAKNALETINTAAGFINSGELSVGLFPEGTRSKDGVLHEFHEGVFMLARKTNAPIVVVTMKDTDKVHKNFPLKTTKVYAKVVRVIEPEEYKGKRTAEISSMVHDIISEDLYGAK